jgi:glutathionylspermidine synthase
VERTGLTFHTLANGAPYWGESAYWEFTSSEIDRVEAATAEIQGLLWPPVNIFSITIVLLRCEFQPLPLRGFEKRGTQSHLPLYGRLDLAFDGEQIKLLEYNADTPTALVEAAVTQWNWLNDCFPDADQFNSLHEKLVAKWKDLIHYLEQPVYFGYDGSEVGNMTISYLRDTAEQGDHRTVPITMQEIGWKSAQSLFVDLGCQPMRNIFKLYPWEWMLKEPFGEHALATISDVHWIEPIWQMLWSNKALLAILWELNPGHELLLPAYLNGPRNLKDYVRKPLFGREGAGITVFRNWSAEEDTSAGSEADAFVYQRLASLASADDNNAVIGSWLVDGEPVGMGIRESSSLITTNTSRFVPHLFH